VAAETAFHWPCFPEKDFTLSKVGQFNSSQTWQSKARHVGKFVVCYFATKQSRMGRDDNRAWLSASRVTFRKTAAIHGRNACYFLSRYCLPSAMHPHYQALEMQPNVIWKDIL